MLHMASRKYDESGNEERKKNIIVSVQKTLKNCVGLTSQREAASCHCRCTVSRGTERLPKYMVSLRCMPRYLAAPPKVVFIKNQIHLRYTKECDKSLLSTFRGRSSPDT